MALSNNPSRWATALGLMACLASVARASQALDELPDPTAVAYVELAPLDDLWYRRPKHTPAPVAAVVLQDEDQQQLLLDTRVPYRDGAAWTMLHPQDGHDLRRRALTGAESVTTTFEITISAPTTTTLQSSTTAVSATTTTSPAATPTSSPLPTFFDGGLSNNFTAESCPAFIDSMLAAEEFNACYPVSLLLQVSADPHLVFFPLRTFN